MLKKLISGGASRKTRLHDERGRFIGWGTFLRHGPQALSSGILLRAFGRRPVKPWISYTAIDVLNRFLTRDSRVLEFGSGMSTVWYAQRAGEIFSVEDYRPWYDKISALFASRGIKNTHYRFAATPSEYGQFMADDKTGFDLIMVDGSRREHCVANAVNLLRPGGILYLDNVDKGICDDCGDIPLAERTALEFARQSGADVRYFTDFAPTQLFAERGLMICTPNPRAGGRNTARPG